jgi:hypothetical protein
MMRSLLSSVMARGRTVESLSPPAITAGKAENTVRATITAAITRA